MTTKSTEVISPVTHAIFDNDGLLLDTENFHEEATNAVLKKYGKGQLTWDVKLRQMGRQQKDSAKVLIDAFELPITVDQAIEELDSILGELFPKAKLMPGAERLVCHLHKHKVPMAICTSSKLWSFNLKRRSQPKLYQMFHHYVCVPNDPSVTRGKPYPDCFLVCASRFPRPTPRPENVLVFEDSLNGVLAARAAGMPVVMVPDARMDSREKSKATLSIDSLLDFRPELFGLPPFED